MDAPRYTTEMRADGQVAVYEQRPRLIATLADEALAQRFVEFLRADSHPGQDQGSDRAPRPMGIAAVETFTIGRGAIEMAVIPFLSDDELLATEGDAEEQETAAAEQTIAQFDRHVLTTMAQLEEELSAPSTPAAPPKPQPASPGTSVASPSAAAPPVVQTTLRDLLSEDQIEAAFRRVAAGEKLTQVAVELKVPYTQLRAAWAAHCKGQQRAEVNGRKEPCSGCGTPHLPTVEHPDRCHRCRP